MGGQDFGSFIYKFSDVQIDVDVDKRTVVMETYGGRVIVVGFKVLYIEDKRVGKTIRIGKEA